MKTLYKIEPIALALFFIAVFFLFAGCGTTSVGKLGTPSGRPEVTIANNNIQTVMDGVASWLASQGKPIDATGAYTISTSFTKKENMLGISYNSGYTAVFTIVQNGADISIYEAQYNQRGNDELVTQSDYEEMQKELTQISEFLKTK